MKLASNLSKQTLLSTSDPKTVELIAVIGGWRELPNPVLSSSLRCLICDGTDHGVVYAYPGKDVRKVWICHGINCETNKLINSRVGTYIPPINKRACEWPLFCELNGIGDTHHEVKFEDIQQSSGKMDYLLKFASKPHGIIFMQGSPGTGKTFASMAVCELFLRKNHSCIFTTAKQVFNNWFATFKSDNFGNYIERITNTNLLVIDDFGTGEVSPGFMSFFMDLINTRLQWTDRGTIITTNLSEEKFNEFCGDALADRIMTGQQFVFSGESRRKLEKL